MRVNGGLIPWFGVGLCSGIRPDCMGRRSFVGGKAYT
jgi:hypothetical protein